MSLNTEISQGLLLDTKKLERVCKDCFKDMSSANIRVGGKSKMHIGVIINVYVIPS